MRSWERDDGLGDELHGSCFRGTLKETGQAGLSAGHEHLPGIPEKTLESGSKPSAWFISLGKHGGSCTAPLPHLQGDGLWLGLAALGGLIIPLGEGQIGSSRDSSCYRRSHSTPLAARASRKFLECLGGELVLQPPPPSAGFWGR